MEKKTHHIPQLIVTALFIGILLSFSILFLVSAAGNRENATASACMDGSQIKGEGFAARFERAVYQNADTISRIREHQFLLFRAVGDSNVIVGEDNFLFEIEDEENHYNYVQDYLGNLSFTDEECAAILSLLTRRADAYEQRGAKYLLVVIPNAQTVYSDKMPAYLGTPEQTRLSRLEDYLLQNGFDGILDLTDALTSQKSTQPLYNNTENSLNALGIYHAYRAVCDHLIATGESSLTPLPYSYLSFYQHRTTGKAIARAAGLEDVVQNLTVSLANNTPRSYSTSYQTGKVTQTTLNDRDMPLTVADTPSVLLQFTNQWERLQAEPFFSNTLKHVTYQTDWMYDEEIFTLANPEFVIQFVCENQLSWLLPRNSVS